MTSSKGFNKPQNLLLVPWCCTLKHRFEAGAQFLVRKKLAPVQLAQAGGHLLSVPSVVVLLAAFVRAAIPPKGLARLMPVMN